MPCPQLKARYLPTQAEPGCATPRVAAITRLKCWRYEAYRGSGRLGINLSVAARSSQPRFFMRTRLVCIPHGACYGCSAVLNNWSPPWGGPFFEKQPTVRCFPTSFHPATAQTTNASRTVRDRVLGRRKLEEGSRCDTGAAPATVTGNETGVYHCTSGIRKGCSCGKARK